MAKIIQMSDLISERVRRYEDAAGRSFIGLFPEYIEMKIRLYTRCIPLSKENLAILKSREDEATIASITEYCLDKIGVFTFRELCFLTEECLLRVDEILDDALNECFRDLSKLKIR